MVVNRNVVVVRQCTAVLGQLRNVYLLAQSGHALLMQFMDLFNWTVGVVSWEDWSIWWLLGMQRLHTLPMRLRTVGLGRNIGLLLSRHDHGMVRVHLLLLLNRSPIDTAASALSLLILFAADRASHVLDVPGLEEGGGRVWLQGADALVSRCKC